MIETTTEGPLAGERACEIGEWFHDEFQQSNGGCSPESGTVLGEAEDTDAK